MMEERFATFESAKRISFLISDAHLWIKFLQTGQFVMCVEWLERRSSSGIHENVPRQIIWFFSDQLAISISSSRILNFCSWK